MSKLSDSELEICIQSGRQKDDRPPIFSLRLLFLRKIGMLYLLKESNTKDILTRDSRIIFYQRITCNVLISSIANPLVTVMKEVLSELWKYT